MLFEPIDPWQSGFASWIAVADDLSVAFLLLLERLSVSERAAFVLREAIDLNFEEMGEVLGVRSDACRQRYHRARR